MAADPLEDPEHELGHRHLVHGRVVVSHAGGDACGDLVQTVLQLAVVTLLPVLPLTLTMISLDELLGRLLELVF